MNQSNVAKYLLAVAAAAGSLVWASTASAQYRVDTGHANDANNRIGSGGYNDTHDLRPAAPSASADQIYTGNVSGLSYFHGRVESPDPSLLMINDQSENDRFLSISAPINYAQRQTGGTNAMPVYNSQLVTSNPPQGTYQPVGNTGFITSAATPTRETGDERLGVVYDTPVVDLPKPGEFVLPGPIDPSTDTPSVYTASPLYGIREWNFADPGDQYFLGRYTNVNTGLGTNNAQLSAAKIQSLRSELASTVVPQSPTNGSAVPGSGNSTNGTGSDLNTSAAIGQSSLSGGQQLASAQTLNSSINSSALCADMNSSQGTRQTLTQLSLPPAAAQSEQVAQLELRLKQQFSKYQKNQSQMTDQQSTAQYNLLRQNMQQLNSEAAKAAAPGMPPKAGPTATATGGQPSAAGSAQPEMVPPRPMETPILSQTGSTQLPPMVINSLATGVKSKGLADILVKAEDLMHDGKFTSALDQYDMAEQVAPNNPLIYLGRANAELGASYYNRSEADLRRAILADPAVLMATYDLNSFIGQDRLAFLGHDLKEIAAQETKSANALFLLGFIAYNVDNPSLAAQYLDQAQQRSGGADPVITMMQRAWNLPKPTASQVANPATQPAPQPAQ